MNSFLKTLTLAFAISSIAFPATGQTPAANTIAPLEGKLNTRNGSRETETKALVDKVIRAYGGIEALKEFNQKGYKATGSLEQISSISGSSNTLDCQLISKGMKQYLKSHFMGQTVITCFDGKTCWTQQGSHAMATDKITSQRILEDQMHGLLLVEELLDKGRKIRLAKPRRLHGKKCNIIVATADDGKDSTLFIDPRTFLVVRSEYTGTDTEQGVNCTKSYEYQDYRSVGKTMAPYRLIEYSDDKKVSDFQIENLNADIKIADAVFKIPEQKIPERLRSGPVVVPFKLVANEILLKAKVNGEKELTFLIDTGATQSILDSDVAKSLGIRESGDFNITTGSGAMKMQFMTLNSLRLGDLTMNDISVAVAPLKNFASNLSIKPAGLIGANLLKRFQLTIDYPERKIELRAPDTKLEDSIEEGIVVETKPSLGVSGLAVEGVLNDSLKLTFLLDSGAAFNHVSEHLVKDLLVDTPILPVGSIKGLDGKAVSTGAVRFNSLKIGDLEVKEPVFSIAPSTGKNNPGLISGGHLAIIGNPLLSQYRITIDYNSQKILFATSAKKEAESRFLSKLERIKRAYYADEKISPALKKLRRLKENALTSKQYGPAGESLAEFTYLAALTGKIKREHVDNSFTKAFQYAVMSQDDAVQGRIMARWALYYLTEKPPNYIDFASSLIGRAINTAPTESSPYSAAGIMLLDKSHVEQVKKKHNLTKTPKAVLLLNQSLMLDPTNWEALWRKYELAKANGKQKEKITLSKLLRKYYPNAMKVQSL